MKEDDKIENIPSYSKLRNEIEGADSLRKFVKFISFFGFKDKGLNETLDKIPDFKKQIIHLSTLPDKFNKIFAQSGWIAHESMNSDLMEKAVGLAESGKIVEANHELVNYYCSGEIEWLLMHFKGIPEFAKRYDFIKLAYQDTIDKKFYSCIPILLMIIDGSVNDIDKNKGFFTESTDLTAWDSIAAHSSGLSVIRDVFNSNRKRTTTEPIDMPYRNGIIHGRDLNYANEIVAAKCWATLIAIKDWAKAIKEGKKEIPEPEKELSFKDNLAELKRSLDQYSEIKKKSAEVSRKVEKWKPRQIVIGVDIPKTGDVSEYTDFYPEKEAILFATYWQKKNYGKIVGQIQRFSSREVSLGKEAKRIRDLLDNKQLIDFEITKVDDKSPAISEITLKVSYVLNNETVTKSITFRFICEGNNGEISMIGDNNCTWRFIDNFFYDLDIIR
ncbi:hypothetical protein [Geofilum rhodophaeum]|uniref:hypothetical protein n=1 Tax=Geofilum rhodophaeum TaxID=1965019 RepID=UPI000B520580|nr:hypothetical protein [Geofilum rhodophaeum]